MSEARLEALAPLLEGSGAGALAWRRLRHSPLREHPSARPLRQAHAHQALDAQLQEREIEKILLHLAAHGIEPLLVKGWSVARLYSEAGLRPFGDLDLVVRPEQGALAASVLQVDVDSDEGEGEFVDLKTRLRPIYGLPLDEALAEAQRVRVGRATVCLLSPEHHLRLLCLHFLRHGAWRPLGLCDIAVALEERPENFSWARCLSADRRLADQVACALGLAHQILGARTAGTAVEERALRLPPWLVPAVLRAWGAPMLAQHVPPPLFAQMPRLPGPVMHALRLRWPSPVEAVVNTRFPLDIHPLPAQVLLYVRMCLRFLGRYAPARRGQRPRSAP